MNEIIILIMAIALLVFLIMSFVSTTGIVLFTILSVIMYIYSFVSYPDFYFSLYDMVFSLDIVVHIVIVAVAIILFVIGIVVWIPTLCVLPIVCISYIYTPIALFVLLIICGIVMGLMTDSDENSYDTYSFDDNTEQITYSSDDEYDDEYDDENEDDCDSTPELITMNYDDGSEVRYYKNYNGDYEGSNGEVFRKEYDGRYYNSSRDLSYTRDGSGDYIGSDGSRFVDDGNYYSYRRP